MKYFLIFNRLFVMKGTFEEGIQKKILHDGLGILLRLLWSLENLFSFWECPDCLCTLKTGQSMIPCI